METTNSVDLKVSDVKTIELFRESIRQDCFKCPLGTEVKLNNHWPVGSRGYGRIMVVGQAPGEEEHRNGQPFVGRAGTIVSKLFRKYCGLGDTQLYYTNTIKCRPHRDIKFKRDNFRACAPYLLREVSIIDPLLIIFFGMDAAKGVVHPDDNPGVGKFFKALIAGRKRSCFIMYHPAVVFHTPKLRSSVQGQMIQLAKYVKKEFGYFGPRLSAIERDDSKSIVSDEDKVDYVLVDTIDKLRDMYYDLKKYDLLGADTETSTLDVWAPYFRLVGVSLAAVDDKAYYIPVGHRRPLGSLDKRPIVQLDWEKQVRPVINKLFNTDCKEIVFHNLSYDYRVLTRCGVPMRVLHEDGSVHFHDSMILSYLNNESVKSLGLKEQAAIYLQRYPQNIRSVMAGLDSFEEVHPEDALKYAADDARNTLALLRYSMSGVKEQSDKFTNGKLLEYIYPSELKAAIVMAEAHMHGVLLDVKYLNEMLEAIVEDIEETEDRIYKICNLIVPSSSQQLIALLRKILSADFCQEFESIYGDLSAQKSQLRNLVAMYKKRYAEVESIGGVSVGSWVPEVLDEYLSLIVRYNHLQKVRKTYIQGMAEVSEHSSDDHLILHPDFNTVGTTSGRMSSGSGSNRDDLD